MTEQKTICATCSRVRYGYCDGEKELESCQFYKKMTNGDCIRAMTDEELAQYLQNHVDCYTCDAATGECSEYCKYVLLDWLKQETIDNDQCR